MQMSVYLALIHILFIPPYPPLIHQNENVRASVYIVEALHVQRFEKETD